MTKDQVLQLLHDVRKRDMYRKGVDLDGILRGEETEALSIAIELVRSARSDNLVFKD
jgi:hypothetical protein